MASKRPARATAQRSVAQSGALDLDSLVRSIVWVHEQLQFRAAKAVDVHLTLRNWLIGCRIREYELKGNDRAAYGERLFEVLAEKLTRQGVSSCDRRQFYRYRDFYLAFPKIVGTLSPQLFRLLPGKMPVGRKKEVMGESDLEDALLGKLQNFLLELGHGFCFEARQKRILIGGEHFFVDLVFYHRVLKCHVLIELKVDDFSHEHLGRLNTYVNWYRAHEMSEGDHPPIGILLCTKKNHALVEYALAGMDNRIFVSKYQLELPKKKDIRRFLEEQIEIAAEKDWTRNTALVRRRIR